MGTQKIKIVIVDDELTSRMNIKKLLRDDKLYEVVADFGDVNDALTWFENEKADIVLMDMNMPKVNGVELINMLCAINSDLHFIAISGYDDFEYVRGCLKNENVADYLLKHQLTQEKLIHALDDMRKKYMIHSHIINQNQDEIVNRIFEDPNITRETVQQLSKENHLHFEYSDMVMFYFSPDMKNIPNDEGQFIMNVAMVMEDIIRQVIKDKHQYLLYRPTGKDIALLMSFANIKSYQYILNTECVMVQRIQNMASRFLNITVTMWIGKIQSNIQEALKEYQFFRHEAIEKLYGEPGEVHFSIQYKAPKERKPFFLSDEEEKQLQYEVSHGRKESLYEHIKKIYDTIRENQSPRENVIQISYKLLSIIEADEISGFEEKKEQVFQELESKDFIHQYQELAWEKYEEFSQKNYGMLKEQYDPAVVQAITYIRNNFTKDITLETCAADIGISYTHMSRTFKKETGVKFTEFLNKTRIEHAKILIDQGKYSLKDIVEQAGFSNYNYFFKVFRELEGITPSEYSKQRKNI